MKLVRVASSIARARRIRWKKSMLNFWIYWWLVIYQWEIYIFNRISIYFSSIACFYIYKESNAKSWYIFDSCYYCPYGNSIACIFVVSKIFRFKIITISSDDFVSFSSFWISFFELYILWGTVFIAILSFHWIELCFSSSKLFFYQISIVSKVKRMPDSEHKKNILHLPALIVTITSAAIVVITRLFMLSGIYIIIGLVGMSISWNSFFILGYTQVFTGWRKKSTNNFIYRGTIK